MAGEPGPGLVMLFIAILSVSLLTLFIGVLVLLRNSQAMSNRLLFLHSAVVAAWMFTNYFSNSVHFSHQLMLLMNHAVLFFGLAMVVTLSLMIEALSFHKRKLIGNLGYVYGAFALVITFTRFVVLGVEPKQNIVAIEFGVLAPLYFLAIVLFVVRAFWIIFHSIRHTSGVQRARMQIIGIGVFGTFSVLILTNTLLPFLFGSYTASVVAPLVFVVMVSTLSYCIARQRLFDIRAAIVRSMGYIFAIAALAAGFGAVAAMVNNLYGNEVLANNRWAVEFLLISTAVLCFQPLRHALERSTSSFLYKDRYDSRQVIDSIADVLVSNLNETILIKKAVAILNSALRASSASYSANSGALLVVHGKPHNKSAHKLLERLENMYVRSSENPQPRDQSLATAGIEVLLKLHTEDKDIGVLAFGPKANGGPYTPQDIDLLTVVAKNLALGINNARSYHEISHFAQTLETEVKNATLKLRQTNKKIRDLSQAKDEFISMASHQLRPQLAAAQGFIELLETRSDLTKNDKQEFLRLTRLAVLRMVRLVADMLNASKIQAGKFDLVYQTFDFIAGIKAEVKNAELVANNAEVTIHTSFSAQCMMITADEVKVHEAAYNLIDNAIRYSPKRSVVEVSVTAGHESIIFTVTDKGIGVSDTDKPRLFRKFYRAQNAHVLKPNGNGIGLFVVKKIIESHGGRILFESELGKGSKFGFELPLAAHRPTDI